MEKGTSKETDVIEALGNEKIGAAASERSSRSMLTINGRPLQPGQHFEPESVPR